jgi:hypothetical protein
LHDSCLVEEQLSDWFKQQNEVNKWNKTVLKPFEICYGVAAFEEKSYFVIEDKIYKNEGICMGAF